MVGCPASRPHRWAAESRKGVPSKWPSGIWPRGLSSPCHLGPHLFPSGTLTGMSWRLQRAAASSNPLQSPCLPRLQTMHIPQSLAHLADTQAGRAEAPWTPNARRRGQDGTGSHPRVGKGGTRAVSGSLGWDTPPISCPQPLLAATKGNVPNSQLPVTLLPKCKRQVKLLPPSSPVPSGQVARQLAPLGPVFRAGLSEPCGSLAQLNACWMVKAWKSFSPARKFLLLS